MNIPIQWRSYLILTIPTVIVLSALGALALYFTFALGHGSVYGLVPMFLLNAEGNIPTFFSSANLMFCSFLLLVAGAGARQTGRPFALAWTLLGLIALLIAIDEGVQIHELLDRNRAWTDGLFEAEGALAGPWVVVYGTLVLAFLTGFAQFFLHLPPKYKLLFSAGAAMYVGASIGLEMIGAEVWTAAGKSLLFEMINWIEEVFEMSAVTLINASLLAYIQTMHGPLAVRAGHAID